MPAVSPPPQPVSAGTTDVFRLLLLLLLAWQTTAATLVVRYSRGVLHEQYAITTTVLCAEVLKLLCAAAMIFRAASYSGPETLARFRYVLQQSLPMIVPAALYLAQNKLNYIALQRLDGSTYSMLIQLKLFSTAVFSASLLGKRLYAYQWRALALLFIGITLVQTRGASVAVAAASGHPTSAFPSLASCAELHVVQCVSDVLTANVGAFAAILQAVLSGLSGVYFEWQLKGRADLSLWDRNLQLSLFGVLLTAASFLSSPTDYDILRISLFHSFTPLAVAAVLLQSVGGLLIAASVQYTDTIHKNFATSVAVLLTAAVSHLLFADLVVDVSFVCGTTAVLMAVFNYSEDIQGLALLIGRNRDREMAALHGTEIAGEEGSKLRLLTPSPEVNDV